MATAFTRVFGYPVEYVDISVERWQQILDHLEGMSAHLIEHLLRVAEAHQQGEFDALTDVVQTIGGAPPKSLEVFIYEHAPAFGLPLQAHPASEMHRQTS